MLIRQQLKKTCKNSRGDKKQLRQAASKRINKKKANADAQLKQ
jgi:hypothetical protein